MPDRVKQSIFNILGCRYECPGELPPLRVADVFSGSGSMGFEALSRGAASCTFYEADRTALQALHRNMETLGAKNISTIVTGDAWNAAGRDAKAGAFDLVFLDPPYRDTQNADSESCVGKFLRRIAEAEPPVGQAAARVPLVVLHHFEKVRFSEMDLAAPWAIGDARRMGTSAVTFFMDGTRREEGASATP